MYSTDITAQKVNSVFNISNTLYPILFIKSNTLSLIFYLVISMAMHLLHVPGICILLIHVVHTRLYMYYLEGKQRIYNVLVL